MAAGLPVITTATNGASQVITHGKDGFIVRSSREISEMAAYVTALHDPGFRRLTGGAAKLTASRHPLTHNADDTLNLIHQCAKLTSAHKT